ncbi:MAG: hypothetical protein CMI36_02350 [Owenweeksia sp.]|nr:hypothetical protein [Owenweeksia sp.]MBF97808.1 hypothetical protein [Owenweeksia sp.]HBF19037.1 hypothetical protein [Cryomorphaceae bacterium]HCQ15327.1 hypothetical protein [Cryomorphaceae bacterium]|tara:strand:+ start:428 stop:955 length:528 start_codon:yes stop_codon:yes gene_type:complete
MKQKQIPGTLKALTFLISSAAIFAFTFPEAVPAPEERISTMQFHEQVSTVVSGDILSQEKIASMMHEAELRKSDAETASEYVENYMNAHFRNSMLMGSTNRVSIAAPGQPDQNESVACNQTALEEVISSTVGYYYVFATRCDGSYKYDSDDFQGGTTLYVRAEASPWILEAFILY